MSEKNGTEFNSYEDAEDKVAMPIRRRMIARYFGMLGDYRLPNAGHLEAKDPVKDEIVTKQSQEQDLT